MKRVKKRILIIGLAVAGFLLLSGLAAVLFPQQVLCVDSGKVKGDVMVVLGGGYRERAKRAAELFREGAAPRVIISGLGDCEMNRIYLRTNGVPDRVIRLEPKSRTTQENALFTIAMLRSERAVVSARPPERQRVILVTTWYHSRRALKTFQHYAPEMEFYSRPSYFGYPRERWVRDGVKPHVRLEYLKLLGYWVRYGVCPI